MPSERAALSTTDFARTFYKIPALMVYRVRCGKPNCHCADGGGHGPYGFLHWRGRGGSQRRRYVRQSEFAAVCAIIAERKAAQRSERTARAIAAIERREVLRICREIWR